VKLQNFGHLMWRSDSLEKTLMLGKIEGRRRLNSLLRQSASSLPETYCKPQNSHSPDSRKQGQKSLHVPCNLEQPREKRSVYSADYCNIGLPSICAAHFSVASHLKLTGSPQQRDFSHPYSRKRSAWEVASVNSSGKMGWPKWEKCSNMPLGRIQTICNENK